MTELVKPWRVLTIKQPWAYALAAGWKDVENRSWGTLYRGPVAIHAGLDVDEEFRRIYPANQPIPPYIHGLTRGAIIAVVDLADVVTDSTSIWAQEGQFHWLLANVRSIEPIPYTGGMGLRHLDPDAEKQIREAVAL